MHNQLAAISWQEQLTFNEMIMIFPCTRPPLLVRFL